jgi:hypothetical protein
VDRAVTHFMSVTGQPINAESNKFDDCTGSVKSESNRSSNSHKSHIAANLLRFAGRARVLQNLVEPRRLLKKSEYLYVARSSSVVICVYGNEAFELELYVVERKSFSRTV